MAIGGLLLNALAPAGALAETVGATGATAAALNVAQAAAVGSLGSPGGLLGGPIATATPAVASNPQRIPIPTAAPRLGLDVGGQQFAGTVPNFSSEIAAVLNDPTLDPRLGTAGTQSLGRGAEGILEAGRLAPPPIDFNDFTVAQAATDLEPRLGPPGRTAGDVAKSIGKGVVDTGFAVLGASPPFAGGKPPGERNPFEKGINLGADFSAVLRRRMPPSIARNQKREQIALQREQRDFLRIDQGVAATNRLLDRANRADTDEARRKILEEGREDLVGLLGDPFNTFVDRAIETEGFFQSKNGRELLGRFKGLRIALEVGGPEAFERMFLSERFQNQMLSEDDALLVEEIRRRLPGMEKFLKNHEPETLQRIEKDGITPGEVDEVNHLFPEGLKLTRPMIGAMFRRPELLSGDLDVSQISEEKRKAEEEGPFVTFRNPDTEEVVRSVRRDSAEANRLAKQGLVLIPERTLSKEERQIKSLIDSGDITEEQGRQITLTSLMASVGGSGGIRIKVGDTEIEIGGSAANTKLKKSMAAQQQLDDIDIVRSGLNDLTTTLAESPQLGGISARLLNAVQAGKGIATSLRDLTGSNVGFELMEAGQEILRREIASGNEDVERDRKLLDVNASDVAGLETQALLLAYATAGATRTGSGRLTVKAVDDWKKVFNFKDIRGVEAFLKKVAPVDRRLQLQQEKLRNRADAFGLLLPPVKPRSVQVQDPDAPAPSEAEQERIQFRLDESGNFVPVQ